MSSEIKFQQFLSLVEELELVEFLPALIENGFDDWEAVKELNENLLSECGICTESFKAQQIIACVKGAEEYDFQKEQYNEKENSQQNQKQQRPNEITRADILKSTAKKRDKNISDSKFFASLFVVAIQDKKLNYLGDDFRLCTGLSNLHLFSNQIIKIDNLDSCTKLTALMLDSNQISKIEGLEKLTRLEKVQNQKRGFVNLIGYQYLNKNRISRLEGMGTLVCLRELQISNQQIGNNEFTFDPESMEGIGYSLRQLECEKNNVNNISTFIHLRALCSLRLANNNIMKFDDFIEPLSQMRCLGDLTVKGNPLATIPKYRDRIVLMSKSLELLDDKQILVNEREFLMNLWKKKHGMMEEKKEVDPKQKGILNPSKSLANVEGKTISAMTTDNNAFKDPSQYQKLNVAKDMRGNQVFQSTKRSG